MSAAIHTTANPHPVLGISFAPRQYLQLPAARPPQPGADGALHVRTHAYAHTILQQLASRRDARAVDPVFGRGGRDPTSASVQRMKDDLVTDSPAELRLHRFPLRRVDDFAARRHEIASADPAHAPFVKFDVQTLALEPRRRRTQGFKLLDDTVLVPRVMRPGSARGARVLIRLGLGCHRDIACRHHQTETELRLG